MVELLRASQIGLIRSIEANTAIEALESLSGESLGGDWVAWVEWYGSTALDPRPDSPAGRVSCLA